MYLNILKKDLKRKKTMNMILLVFIILATMFVASGLNNVFTVRTARIIILTRQKSVILLLLQWVMSPQDMPTAYSTKPIV